MKHFKRLNLFKASNVTFNPENKEAYSYGCWLFTKVINGKLVFNNYAFSSTTQRHQSKVRSLLSDLNISIDFEIECPKGLHSIDAGQSVDMYYSNMIKRLKEEIAKPRSHKKKNIERQNKIDELAKKCVDFKLLNEAV